MLALLHAKSHYSLGSGCAPPEDLVRGAAGYGYAALALTDLENLYGQVRFHLAAKAHGLKAVTGVELRGGYCATDPGRIQGRLILLARDRAGYESICRILTARRSTGPEPAPDPLRCLDAFPSGVFYLSDDPEVIRRLLAEGVPEPEIRFLVGSPAVPGAPRGIRAVADADIRLTDSEDRDLLRLLTAIRRRVTLAEVMEEADGDGCLPGPEAMVARFTARPDLLEESLRVAGACELDLSVVAPLLTTPAESETPPDEALGRLSRERLGHAPPGHRDRLEQELAELSEAGLAGYFLAASAIAEHARSGGIRLAGRGAVAGSLVAHVLGLSEVDPVRQGLSFERLLHQLVVDRSGIALDVAADRREELVDWVFRHFGEGAVALVAEHQCFGRRAAFRDGLRALAMDLAGIDRFIQAFPAGESEDPPGALPVKLLPPRLHAAVPLIERLVGKPRQLGVQAGALVIADSRMDRHTALERSPRGSPLTQHDAAALARLGLLTLELVGSPALAAHALAARRYGGPPPAPDQDPATIQSLRSGNTIGCPEIEAPVVRSVLKRLPVRGTADLMAALAIVRPGPGAAAARTEFIRRANGESRRDPPHPRLGERLAGTHGMLLFDEDLNAAIAELTGWPPAAADDVRCALATAPVGSSERLALKRRFLVAASHHGIARGDGERVWQLLDRFAAHSFSKADAATGALLAWEAASLKTHHPVAFTCGVLNHYSGHYPLRAVASDMVRCGVRLLPPHVNHSGASHEVEDDAVRIGLGAVKFLTTRNRQWILKERPFPDLRTLVARVPLSAAELDSLVLSGACDDLAPLSAAAYPFPHQELLTRWKREPGLRGLDGFVARDARGLYADTHRILVRLRNELRLLGMHVSGHPVGVLRAEAEREGCVTTRELAVRAGQFVRVAGVVVATRRSLDRAGRAVVCLTLEDELGLAEAVLSGETAALPPRPGAGSGALLVGGWVEADDDEPFLTVSEVESFDFRGAAPSMAEPV